MKGTNFARRAFTLIEILIVLVIIMALAALLLPHYLGGVTADGKKVRAPVTMAKDTICQEYLGQVRMAISMNKNMDTDADAANPRSLAELKLPYEVTHCPVGGEPYVYNPQTGEVRCPHPGHQNF